MQAHAKRETEVQRTTPASERLMLPADGGATARIHDGNGRARDLPRGLVGWGRTKSTEKEKETSRYITECSMAEM